MKHGAGLLLFLVFVSCGVKAPPLPPDSATAEQSERMAKPTPAPSANPSARKPSP